MKGFKLQLKDYCESCPHFSADVNIITLCGLNGNFGDTVIQCEKADACERMYRRSVSKTQ